MALISIIIPSYNHADYLGQAVQSAIDQTFSDIEIIVIDDGSTDHTQEVLAKFHDPRLHSIRQSNEGLLAARNRGIRESSAPFVTFLDADDLFQPEKLAVLYSYLKDHPQTGFVAGSVLYIDGAGQVVGIGNKTADTVDVADLLLGNSIQICGVLLRREWLERVGGFAGDRLIDASGDWDLWLRLALAGCKIDCVQQAVAYYRITTDQMSQNPGGMRSASLAVLNRFFSHSDLPQDLKAMQNQAMAIALVNAAARAYYAGLFDVGNEDLSEAVRFDPDLAANQYQRLSEMLLGWAQAPYPLDAESYLNEIYQHLSGDLGGLRPGLRKAMAALALQPLFVSSTRAKGKDRQALLRAVKTDPSWLFNRGVLRMLFDTWIP